MAVWLAVWGALALIGGAAFCAVFVLALHWS